MNSSSDTPDKTTPAEQAKVSVVRLTDPTEIGDSIDVLDQDVVNLAARNFEVKRITVPLDECCLLYQWTNSRLRTRTRVHDEHDACTILGPDARGSLDGAELSPYAMIVASPGADSEIIVDSMYESVTLLVPPQVLEKHLSLRGKTAEFTIPDGSVVWHPDASAAEAHYQLGLRIAGAAEETPDVFNENHWARYGAQVEFIDSILSTIESCDSGEEPDVPRKAKSYSQIVKTCEDFTLQLDERRPYVSELCEAAHVSERTLQYAFKEMMGMSPLTYLHRLRLHRAREALRNAGSDSTTVTEVAMHWGFWHFGEFSRAYKNCFGEVPSQTLKDASGN